MLRICLKQWSRYMWDLLPSLLQEQPGMQYGVCPGPEVPPKSPGYQDGPHLGSPFLARPDPEGSSHHPKVTWLSKIYNWDKRSKICCPGNTNKRSELSGTLKNPNLFFFSPAKSQKIVFFHLKYNWSAVNPQCCVRFRVYSRVTQSHTHTYVSIPF